MSGERILVEREGLEELLGSALVTGQRRLAGGLKGNLVLAVITNAILIFLIKRANTCPVIAAHKQGEERQ
jgi:hypothetical protein